VLTFAKPWTNVRFGGDSASLLGSRLRSGDEPQGRPRKPRPRRHRVPCAGLGGKAGRGVECVFRWWRYQARVLSSRALRGAAARLPIEPSSPSPGPGRVTLLRVVDEPPLPEDLLAVAVRSRAAACAHAPQAPPRRLVVADAAKVLKDEKDPHDAATKREGDVTILIGVSEPIHQSSETPSGVPVDSRPLFAALYHRNSRSC